MVSRYHEIKLGRSYGFGKTGDVTLLVYDVGVGVESNIALIHVLAKVTVAFLFHKPAIKWVSIELFRSYQISRMLPITGNVFF